jgi:ferredoxin-thioredoxin reductase catalytic subunit
MGKLKDFIDKIIGNEPEVDEPQQAITTYNRLWLNKVSNATGFIPNEDGNKVNGILGALNRKDGHCPCGGNGDQFLCPCVVMREKGICKCGLFVNVRPVEPKGSSGGRIKNE